MNKFNIKLQKAIDNNDFEYFFYFKEYHKIDTYFLNNDFKNEWHNYIKGYYYEKNNNYDEAIEYYLLSNNYISNWKLGKIYKKIGFFDDSIKHFEISLSQYNKLKKNIKNNFNILNLKLKLFELYVKNENYDKACDIFDDENINNVVCSCIKDIINEDFSIFLFKKYNKLKEENNKLK